MTDHVARLYAVALALVVLFLTWAVVAARPWAPPAAAEKDPRIVALERREAKLRRQSVRVERQVKRRFAVYEARLRKRKRAIAAIGAANARAAAGPSAAPPSVGVVSLPPITSTSSS
jgi:hypothetical protein